MSMGRSKYLKMSKKELITELKGANIALGKSKVLVEELRDELNEAPYSEDFDGVLKLNEDLKQALKKMEAANQALEDQLDDDRSWLASKSSKVMVMLDDQKKANDDLAKRNAELTQRNTELRDETLLRASLESGHDDHWRELADFHQSKLCFLEETVGLIRAGLNDINSKHERMINDYLIVGEKRSA